ncbi:MAG: peroxiredoxin [Ignavibacteria bacterium]|jgi:peroxiredoxin (alkyl hydroperoxide reductase subunit C)|nr:peroxiredoxin [Ignavibacteria bacterium]MCU7503691.1 peroxiredoxin [Ignavibacteria bacterium]MCU7517662.1 peroxiredoxin [Ignavibacteria bacterium]
MDTPKEPGPGIPLIGEKFPLLEVQTTRGFFRIPQDFQGKWIVLFSHPADFTPVCTTEFIAFARRDEEFKKLNTQLIGLSIDQVFSHIKWIEWMKEKLNTEIPFPVIADDMGRVAMKLGMIHPEKGTNTVRAVFIVDPKGIIRLMVYYPQEVGRQVNEILRALKALQTADEKKVAMPENWPNNELIGDKVIIPPPKDVVGAEERLKTEEGFDWWFSYKSLPSN